MFPFETVSIRIHKPHTPEYIGDITTDIHKYHFSSTPARRDVIRPAPEAEEYLRVYFTKSPPCWCRMISTNEGGSIK